MDTKVYTMSNVLSKWQRYVDDIIAFVKEDQVTNVLKILNKYHKDIKFTHETEENNKLPFLDVLLRRTENNKLLLKVYQKKRVAISTFTGKISHHTTGRLEP